MTKVVAPTHRNVTLLNQKMYKIGNNFILRFPLLIVPIFWFYSFVSVVV